MTRVIDQSVFDSAVDQDTSSAYTFEATGGTHGFILQDPGITVIGARPNRHKGGNAIVRNLAFVGQYRSRGFGGSFTTFHQRNVEITRHHTIDYNEVYTY